MKTPKEKARTIRERAELSFEAYREKLLSKPPEDIMDYSYRTVICLEIKDLLSDEQRLIKLGSVLDELIRIPDDVFLDTLYYEWIGSDIQPDTEDCLMYVISRYAGQQIDAS